MEFSFTPATVMGGKVYKIRLYCTDDRGLAANWEQKARG